MRQTVNVMNPDRIILAITGASGAQYGLRLLECLLGAECEVYLMISQPAQVVIATETDLDLPGRVDEQQIFLSEYFDAADAQLHVFGRDQWMSPVASGSNTARAMVICPCSSATLSSVANGASRDLIERAADVMLKERRQLILVHRETPVSSIHLENMLKLSREGVVIMPASPGFYHQPAAIEELTDFLVARILDQLHIKHSLIPRWGEPQ
ncbi:Flavin prenyltransferase UbiX [hydrothermal vent metagenome]|uniref:flavin prenyltransferase n=1 Tax=hydrothermal vent metagenome TaxID=652676 RepID=A0A3B1A9T2_9ZZZZ